MVMRTDIARKWAMMFVAICKNIMQHTTRTYCDWTRKYSLVCQNGWKNMDKSDGKEPGLKGKMVRISTDEDGSWQHKQQVVLHLQAMYSHTLR